MKTLLRHLIVYRQLHLEQIAEALNRQFYYLADTTEARRDNDETDDEIFTHFNL